MGTNFTIEIREGDTPLESTEGLLDESIRSYPALCIAEGKNVHKAVVKYLAKKPVRRSAKFDYAWAFKLHKEMFGDVWAWAGNIRANDVSIGNCPPHQIAERMAALIGDLEFWEKNWSDVLEQAVNLHHRSVQIHPFRNGNGRWSRMLSSIWLALKGHPIPSWPGDMGTSKSPIRREYIECLCLADNGDIKPLYNLHKKYILE